MRVWLPFPPSSWRWLICARVAVLLARFEFCGPGAPLLFSIWLGDLGVAGASN